ncbi:MAG: glycerol-3-phosphate dehydrogenase/oxidase [Pseudomonadota bacterium]
MMRRDYTRLDSARFDLLVCGGGIYGGWTAYDAALRGLKVALLDQGDWAGGTSSASSKLIHGGLRYLETLDLKLIRKSLKERQMLLRAAPHRVWPLRFGIPLYPDSRIGALRLKAGLTLYDLLAGTRGSDQAHRRYGRREFAARFPCLAEKKLMGGFSYADAQTDDARFVIEIIDGAIDAGAVCLNYCKVLHYLEDQGRVYGAVVQDRTSGTEVKIHAAQVVNATGQWTEAFHKGDRLFRLSKGTHLVLPKVLDDEALLLTAKSDGRVFFIIPWYGRTLIGTTDSDYSGPVDRITVGPDEVAYLLEETNRVIGRHRWEEKDIVGAFAGLRVLRRSDKTSPSAVSRDWHMKTADNGVMYSIGGKFTSAREDAACMVDAVCRRLGIDAECKTNGRNFPWKPERTYPAWFETNLNHACQLGIDAESALWLLRRHGNRVTDIFRLIENNRALARRIVKGVPIIQADLAYCARNEMVVHLEDLLRRRIPLLILAKLTPTELRGVAERVAGTLQWDEGRLKSEVDACAGTCLT